jgi:hypothetical protein
VRTRLAGLNATTFPVRLARLRALASSSLGDWNRAGLEVHCPSTDLTGKPAQKPNYEKRCLVVSPPDPSDHRAVALSASFVPLSMIVLPGVTRLLEGITRSSRQIAPISPGVRNEHACRLLSVHAVAIEDADMHYGRIFAVRRWAGAWETERRSE